MSPCIEFLTKIRIDDYWLVIPDILENNSLFFICHGQTWLSFSWVITPLYNREESMGKFAYSKTGPADEFIVDISLELNS